MPSQRTEAEAIAIALEIGLLDAADAVHWADRQIEISDVPHVVLCDVAMAASKFPQDVAHMLRSLPGELDHEGAVQAVLRYAYESLVQSKRTPLGVASALFQLAMADDLPEGELKSHAWGYWDEIDMARDGGYYRSEAEITSHMTATLKAHLDSHHAT